MFYKDEVAAAPGRRPGAAAPLDQTFPLHSKPGSTTHDLPRLRRRHVGGTAWNASYPATPDYQPAWDLSGDGAVFDDDERDRIQAVWDAVAEDYAPFDVDVTTADPGAAGIVRANEADSAYGSHVVISPSTAATPSAVPAAAASRTSASSTGLLRRERGLTGYGYFQPAFVFPQKLRDPPKPIAEAARHEVGHNWASSTTANASEAYDTGHGGWAAIMGAGYYKPISQWSRGDYPGANNQQDDVAHLRRPGSRDDESTDEHRRRRRGAHRPAYVTSRDDVDTFLLGTCTGAVTVTADAVGKNANLDIGLTMLDATGQAVATDDPAVGQDQRQPRGRAGRLADPEPDRRAPTTPRSTASATAPGTPGYDDYGRLGATRCRHRLRR